MEPQGNEILPVAASFLLINILGFLFYVYDHIKTGTGDWTIRASNSGREKRLFYSAIRLGRLFGPTQLSIQWIPVFFSGGQTAGS